MSNKIQDILLTMSDEEYRNFHKKLIPTIDENTIIGIRVPRLRKLAKELYGSPEADAFINELPHFYYEENNLHSFLISLIKDFSKCANEVDRFLPYVNNWATCDSMSPKVFSKHTDELLPWINKWLVSDEVYTVRFGIEMLMSFYLDDRFMPEYNEAVAKIRSDEYYVNMMKAWYFATALAKQYDATLPFIENKALDVWSHNKAIQKSRESYRISDEKKAYLTSLKIKQS